MIQTRKSEERYVTSDPKKMLGRFLVNKVCRKWTETFIDEATGETVPVERSEILFEKGTLITQDNLAKIRFYMAEGAFDEVEVSNQQRCSFEMQCSYLYPYMAKVQVKDKKMNVLLYATGVENAIEIMKDYIELNFEGKFKILMVKEYDTCIVLIDRLKGVKYSFEKDFCLGKISADEFLEALVVQVDEEERQFDEEEKVKMKWYKISAKVVTNDKEGDFGNLYSFVVKSSSAERANMLINIYLKEEQDKQEKKAIERGELFEKKEIKAAIEVSNIMSVGCFIPKEFSEVYKE